MDFAHGALGGEGVLGVEVRRGSGLRGAFLAVRFGFAWNTATGAHTGIVTRGHRGLAMVSVRQPMARLMKRFREFVVHAVVSGLLVILPVYLAFLLLAKIADTVAGLVRPLAVLLPEWLPGEKIMAVLLVLVVCFLIGAAVSTPLGQRIRGRIESSLFLRLPGYRLARSLAQQLAGESLDKVWKPALAELEDALVPAFIIEELDDGSFTVFVPSVPTPLAGTVYILTPERVHPVDVSMAKAIKAVARWGQGSKDLVAAMKTAAERPSWER